jgi:hypothetical protein
VPIWGDTLTLKNGERIFGTFEGGNASAVNFRTNDGQIHSYDILNVQQIQFGGDEKSATSQLHSGADQMPYRRDGSTANSHYTIPSGTRITVRMLDGVSSEKQKVGEEFRASLDEPIIYEGVEVVPRNADVRGRITEVTDTQRVTGTTELSLELTRLTAGGITYAISTSEHSDMGESRSGETLSRAGTGAGVGAAVGAIAGKSAAIGAGAAAGGTTAIQVLTKGEKINVPAETRLEFTLSSPLAIARP